MKLKILSGFLLFSAVVFAAYSAAKNEIFAPAEDFPRGALVYLQVADLPEFIKIWNESKFKEKYLASENFSDLQNRHLGRKLASRWREFNDAAGFSFDLKTLAAFSENRAALAVYDVGKLDFVFIAPVSDEVFAATKFFQNKDKFAEETLDDGTKIYRADVAADRGRQKQQLIFAHLKNRLILTTDFNLLAQTVSNIQGSNRKNRLSDEPSFKMLADKTEAHLATVWTDQTALNDDYYFKHYWLMSDAKDLQNLRAGMFDFERQTDKLIEKRRFLLNNTVVSKPLDATHSAAMLAHLPADIPFYRLRNADSPIINEVIEQTIFDRPRADQKTVVQPSQDDFSEYYSDDYGNENYQYLGENYDRNIDQVEESEITEKIETKIDFAKIFNDSQPQSVLNLARPENQSAPLFVKFQRAAVFYLAAPDVFNRARFESEIARKFTAQTMIDGADANFQWKTKTDGKIVSRELDLPMLDWQIVYRIENNQLILANDQTFFEEIAATENQSAKTSENAASAEVSVINLDQRGDAYDRIFNRLDEQNAADDFFVKNIPSLLDAMSDIGKIEVKKNFTGQFFEEELILHFKRLENNSE